MTAAMKLEKMYTIEDIYALPEGQRAELVDGQIYYMASPGRTHQKLLMILSNAIFRYIQDKDGDCEVYPAPFAVFLNEDDKTCFEPDISVICDKDKLTEEGCKGAPDWIIEIVSASSRKMGYYTKLFKYRTAEVREYWVVDSDKNTVTVYDFENDNMEEYSFGEDVPVGIYKGFVVRVE